MSEDRPKTPPAYGCPSEKEEPPPKKLSKGLTQEIVEKTFISGLKWIFDAERASNWINNWYEEADPVYLPLLKGVNRLRRRRFITDWHMGQILATFCRFFMEEAICRLLLKQKEAGRKIHAAYTMRDLISGHLATLPEVTFMGEDREEWALGRGWKTSLHLGALKEVDGICLEEDRRHDRILLDSGNRLGAVLRRREFASLPPDEAGVRIVNALAKTSGNEPVYLSCNLVVIGPVPGGEVHAFRFVNTRHASKGDVKEERKNYL